MELTKKMVTPKMAKKYLENNSINRRLKPNIVTKYANEIAGGRWKKDTAETIKISTKGVLLDGQHRLMAIVEADKAIEMLVATNVPEENFKVIDTGVTRNAADSFKIDGIQNYSLMPAIINMWHILRSGGRGDSYKAYQVPSITTSLELYYERPNFWQDVAHKTTSWYISFNRIINPRMVGGIYVFLHEKNAEDAEAFMEQLTTGINVKNTTISYLRNKLINDKLSPRRLGKNFKIALIIKTWNYFRKKDAPDSARNLKYDPAKESFPFPV